METKNILCDICEKIFTTFWNLKAHKKITHSILAEFFCVCGKKYKRFADLKRHQAVKHFLDENEENQGKIETKRFECNKCQKLFARKDTLVKHYRSLSHKNKRHHDEKEVQDEVDQFCFCKFCKQNYAGKDAMRKHLMTKKHKKNEMEAEEDFGDDEETEEMEVADNEVVEEMEMAEDIK